MCRDSRDGGNDIAMIFINKHFCHNILEQISKIKFSSSLVWRHTKLSLHMLNRKEIQKRNTQNVK